MPAFVLYQNDGEIAAAESKPLLDAPRNGYLHTTARNALSLTEHPYGAERRPCPSLRRNRLHVLQ
jgi:hypothetical protein